MSSAATTSVEQLPSSQSRAGTRILSATSTSLSSAIFPSGYRWRCFRLLCICAWATARCWPGWPSASSTLPLWRAVPGRAVSAITSAPKSPFCGAWPPAPPAARSGGAALCHAIPLAQLFSPDCQPPHPRRGREPGFHRIHALGHHQPPGQDATAKVISYNGISTYGGMALGAPLGVILDQPVGTRFDRRAHHPRSARSASRSPGARLPVPVEHGEHLPFAMCSAALLRTAWAWRWAASVTAFSPPLSPCFTPAATGTAPRSASPRSVSAFIVARLIFIRTINRFGGFPVAMVCLDRRIASGCFLLWQACSPWMAIAGAAMGGFGFSLVFPAIGVEAVKRVA